MKNLSALSEDQLDLATDPAHACAPAFRLETHYAYVCACGRVFTETLRGIEPTDDFIPISGRKAGGKG